MNTNYYCVTEGNGDGKNIGVVLAISDTEFREKLVKCLEEHFDETVEIPSETKLEDVMYGRELLLDIKFPNSEFESLDNQVYICETWVY